MYHTIHTHPASSIHWVALPPKFKVPRFNSIFHPSRLSYSNILNGVCESVMRFSIKTSRFVCLNFEVCDMMRWPINIKALQREQLVQHLLDTKCLNENEKYCISNTNFLLSRWLALYKVSGWFTHGKQNEYFSLWSLVRSK